MWKTFLCLFLLLLLGFSPLWSLTPEQERDQALEELNQIFNELEELQILLDDGTTITAASLIELKSELKKLKANNSELLKLDANLAASLNAAEQRLKSLKLKILLDKVAAYILGIATGIILTEYTR